MKTVSQYIEFEISKFKEARTSGDHPLCFRHLGRAHVLSQSSTLSHLYVHFLMIGYAIERKDMKEILGQILRILVTIPGHLLGRVPVGNIGWSTVGLVQRMPIPDDLKKVINNET